MTRRVWVRATAIVVAVVAVITGLTVYFSSESAPPCRVAGVAKWRPPTDAQPHRYMLVFPDDGVCFFALDDQQRLAGELQLPQVRAASFAAPLQHDVAIRTSAGPYTLEVETGRIVKGGVAPFDH